MLMNEPAHPQQHPLDNSSPPRKPVAIFVCHGMGQQVHFETIEDVVNALLREQGRREIDPDKKQSIGQRLAARPPRTHEASRAEFAELFTAMASSGGRSR